MGKDKSNVVLVTGASGGIGKAIVNKYSRQGLTMAIADKDEELLDYIAKRETTIPKMEALNQEH